MLEMHQADAAAREIVSGDEVEVFNGRGHVVAEGAVNGRFPPGLWRRGWTGISSRRADECECADFGDADRYWRRADVLLDAG